MLELRKDPVIGRWVIISTNRGKRPTYYEFIPRDNHESLCPFCKGNEQYCPDAVLEYYPPGKQSKQQNWTLRVVPNKFPALKIEGQLHRQADGIYDKMNGIGAHEVIIETPDHDKTLADLGISQIREVLNAYKARILDLQNDKRFQYAMIFKNHGKEAGASLSHSHSQLIATPIVPKRVSEELDGSLSYFEYKERCIFCDIVHQEIADKKRLIEETNHFLSISPYAPRFPFETWILPKRHECFFEQSSDTELDDLSIILSSTLRRMNSVLETPPYNFLIHNAPFRYDNCHSYHWHIEIMPISSRVAGFEWGTGFYINPTPPEESAAFLRNIDL